jgi:structural maintenance of chromosome 1
MEAICFVLTIRARDLRGRTVSDLVFRAEGESDAEAAGRTASVTLELIPSALAPMPADLAAAAAPLSFRRSISGDGTSHYSVDGRTLTQTDYKAVLEQHDIFPSARHGFLVFQGDVQRIAVMSPSHLADFFETVSGSAAFKPECERLSAELAEAEQKLLDQVRDRRVAARHKRDARVAAKEAQRFDELVEDTQQLTRGRLLLRLGHAEARLRPLAANEAEAAKTVAVDQEAIEAARRDARIHARTMSQLRQKLQAADAALKRADAGDEAETHKLRLQRASERVTNAESDELAARRLLSMRDRELAKLRQQQDDCSAAVRALEAQAEAEEAHAALIDPSVRAQFDAALNDFKAQNTSLFAARRAAEREAETALRLSEQAASTASRLTALADQARDRIEELDTEAAAARSEHKSARHLESAAVQALRTVQEAIETSAETRRELDGRLKSKSSDLSRLRASARESKRDASLRKAQGELKKRYPGVFGMLRDLIRPVDPRHEAAVAAALGRFADAIVVDSSDTGSLCMQHLRQQHLCRAMFLPCDRLQPRRPGSLPAGAPAGVRLVIDAVKVPENALPAARFALGDTLLVENLADARRVAFDGPERRKVVTLSGGVMTRGGLMTGGGMMDRSLRTVSPEQLTALEDAVADLERRLRTEHSPQASAARGAERQQATIAADAAHTRSKELEALYESLRHRHMEETTNLKLLETDAARAVSERERLQAASTAAADAASAVVRRVHRALTDALGDLLPPGVTPASLEAAGAKRAPETQRKRLELESQRARIGQALSMEEQDRTRVRERLERIAGRLAAAKEAEASCRQEAKKLEAAAAQRLRARGQLEEELDQLRADLEAAETAAKDARAALRRRTAQASAATKRLLHAQSEARQVQEDLFSVLEECRMQGTALPIIPASSRTRGPRRRARRAHDEDSSDASEPSDASMDGAADAPPAVSVGANLLPPSAFSASGMSPADAAALVLASRIDYSSVQDELDRAVSGGAGGLRAELDALNAQLVSVEAELRTLTPTAGAKEQLQRAVARLQEQESAKLAANQTFAALQTALAQEEERRAAKFRQCFDLVAATIPQTYRDLTSSRTNPAGGHASLLLMDAERPWASGVRFTAMPPAKRFRSMDSLSGGEQAVAALALVFALQAFRTTPFLVLDEVEAALDSINVDRVARYLQRRTAGGQNQVIMVSLKDASYFRANQLIGVTRAPGIVSSQVFQLSLPGLDKLALESFDRTETSD